MDYEQLKREQELEDSLMWIQKGIIHALYFGEFSIFAEPENFGTVRTESSPFGIQEDEYSEIKDQEIEKKASLFVVVIFLPGSFCLFFLC